MPIPIILTAGAAMSGAVGAGNIIQGVAKMHEAGEKSKSANEQHALNTAKLDGYCKAANSILDSLGLLELNIMKDFKEFSDTIAKIQGRPSIKEYQINGVDLPEFNQETLENASVGAMAIMGGLEGLVTGAIGDIAAHGAILTVAGTAFAGGLNGIAATNATMAALGGGSLAAGGGGMALGSTVLSGATFGLALLVGGMAFNRQGSEKIDEADKVWRDMKSAEEKINEICNYLEELEKVAGTYRASLEKAYRIYEKVFQGVSVAVNEFGIVDYIDFSEEEKIAMQNSILLVGLLYKMCKVNLVMKADEKNEINQINNKGIELSLSDCDKVVGTLAR